MTQLPGGEDQAFHATGIGDLAALTAFVERACARVGASEDAVSELRLATEEVFANILDHGYGNRSGPVAVRVDATPERVVVRLSDEAPDFDPASVAAPDLDAGWEERGLGGLGWHLVRRVMDEVRREPGERGGNVYTLVKNLVASPPGAANK